jgi:anti-sigma factor RsiW
VNCREFEEQISAAVDQQLKGSERALFDAHTNQCPPCRRAFEEEVQTKELIRTRVAVHHTPPALAAAIVDHLVVDQETPTAYRNEFWKILSSFLTPKFAFGLAIVSAATVILVTQPSLWFWQSAAPQGPDMDVMHQSHAGYEAMLGSGSKPQMVSSEPELVKSYFAGKTDFPVHVPSMKDCTLLGGGLNEVGGAKFANVVYQGHSGMIYLCQVCLETAMRGEKLSLSAEAKRDIQQTGWHKCTLSDGDALVLWSRGSTLCAAVAKMTPDDLAACLTSEEATPAW